MNEVLINDLYEKLIPLGQKFAKDNCNGGYPNKDDCTWYHGNWMLLRYLGVVSNPYWHENFYRNVFKSIDYNKTLKVGVLGTADFSMPLLCSEIGVDKVNILDICNTPLMICDLVASHLKLDWVTGLHDVCADLDEKLDIIINDAFLSRFKDKDAVLRGIFDSLKDDGYYITTLKQGKWNNGGEVAESLRLSFIDKVRTRYMLLKGKLPDVDIEAIAAKYVDKMASFPVRNDSEIKEIFENAGFKILKIFKNSVEGEYQNSCYFEILAQKNK